jgi:hypothetical protein
MLSYLELVREEVKQRTFRPRQYGVLESLYRGMMGWRQGLIFRLLHRFGDPAELRDQREDEEYRQFLRAQDIACDPPGEAEYQELLRLLEEEIASVREEFAYAEKANEERAAIERDACLAPEGGDVEDDAAPGSRPGPLHRPQSEDTDEAAEGIDQPPGRSW